MAAFLVLPAWVGAFLLFRRVFADWREAALAACVTWGVVVVVLTEGMSLFHALAFGPLLTAWGLISCASLVVCVRLWPKMPVLALHPFRRELLMPVLLVGGMAVILLTTLVVALISPPNNWDSMTYHMARVANWVDHRTVRDYPTHILRQLYLGPWAEFAVTNLQILAGGDRFANLVQYVAMLGNVLGVSLLAKKLGAAWQGQLFAAVFCATIPMGVLQASSTQTDQAAAFWFLCFLNFLVALLGATSANPWSEAVLVGASLGLAVLTKVTALVFAAPFLLWAAFVLLPKHRLRAVFLLATIGVVGLAINAGHLLRNELAFGWPLGPPSETTIYTNEIHSPAALASNVIRNLAVHLAVPAMDMDIRGEVFRLHGLTGFDINDRRTTFLDTTFYYHFALSEDYAGNPLHLIVAVISFVAALWSFRTNRLASAYSVCLAGAFLLFCGYLKWEPWVSRLHLPLFVAAAPVGGLVFSRDGVRRVGYVVAILLLVVGIFYATENEARPLIAEQSILRQSRTSLYFAVKPEHLEPFLAAAAEVVRGNPSRIGLITGVDDWEYPLRVLVRGRQGAAVSFEHVHVRNESRNCPPELTPAIPPDKIVVIGAFQPESVPPGYRAAFESPLIRVFEK
jgi:Dolichyl-phosphate-mannose-protein mannosyltransferase